ncbi:Nucleoside 5-triphosphatase RdgB (dHAPTP, dITP, XTP-specific) [uncultured Candidatus Thioglobus sp.]|nr:Nucleoside 5-triphosphatase RdgB (dHAPTP, dITP, XTP-specific) [uncultured Candidatus Thioglobus sp.]
MQKIILATGNQGKVAEFNALLKAHFIVEPQSDYQVPEAQETGLSFVENAILKARNAAQHTGMWALADDSGLSVEALNGAPGIYSARYSGGDDEQNIDKLLDNMQGVENRSAYYYCAIALVKHTDDPTPIIAVGEWHGEILTARQGKNGFGYDAVFYVPEFKKSSAELDTSQKNSVSHRALALNNLFKQL